jgi:hypothetical protein
MHVFYVQYNYADFKKYVVHECININLSSNRQLKIDTKKRNTTTVFGMRMKG